MCWKFVSKTIASVLSRFSFNNTTTIQQLKNSSNNKNTVKSTAFWFSVWKKWCLEKGIAKEIENYKPTQLNTLLERFGAEIKNKRGQTLQRMILFHWKWFRHRLNNSLNYLAWLWTLLCLKGVKISLYITVLIIHNCFDQTQNVTCWVCHLKLKAILFYSWSKIRSNSKLPSIIVTNISRSSPHTTSWFKEVRHRHLRLTLKICSLLCSSWSSVNQISNFKLSAFFRVLFAFWLWQYPHPKSQQTPRVSIELDIVVKLSYPVIPLTTCGNALTWHW